MSLESQHASASNFRKAVVYILGLKHTFCSAVDVVHGMASGAVPGIHNKLMRLILLSLLCKMNRQNSIIIIGGPNLRGWPEKMSSDCLRSLVVDVLHAVKRAVVLVIFDMGGMDTPIPNELLDSVAWPECIQKILNSLARLLQSARVGI
ncbi:hypothetical protein Bca52824_026616 [Brassica carinata]|uniref:Uncharacterized protein n=1 Tax=Brassica carinata TaxID=52824 RepID=A0A8X7SIC1_BRACI|nr:hypothetical protein Bca52824_026616 [Brassica carinata]